MTTEPAFASQVAEAPAFLTALVTPFTHPLQAEMNSGESDFGFGVNRESRRGESEQA